MGNFNHETIWSFLYDTSYSSENFADMKLFDLYGKFVKERGKLLMTLF